MQPVPFGPEQLEELLPLAVQWAEAQEVRILQYGVVLSDVQISDAAALGVANPERVRLHCVDAIPRPRDPILLAAADATGLLGPSLRGITFRYGIYLRRDVCTDRILVAHELVHTSQYERMGGFLPFLRQYLLECLTVGYAASPMEHEAIGKAGSLETP